MIRTDRLYHYLLGGNEALDSIRELGLLPLSDLPRSERQQTLAEFYRGLYTALAEPLLNRPYINSGVFLTPIDFRLLPGTALAAHRRIAIPPEAIRSDCAVLTYQRDEERYVDWCTQATLQRTAELWPEADVRAWFGRNPSMLFFHVPQVAVYQEGGIPIRPEWVE